MSTRSQDSHPRGTLVRDRDGDIWRKGTAWWHWTAPNPNADVHVLLWSSLESMYGPLVVVSTPAPRAPIKGATR